MNFLIQRRCDNFSIADFYANDKWPVATLRRKPNEDAQTFRRRCVAFAEAGALKIEEHRV